MGLPTTVSLSRMYAWKYLYQDSNGVSEYRTDPEIEVSCRFGNAPAVVHKTFWGNSSPNIYDPKLSDTRFESTYKSWILLSKDCFGKEYKDSYRIRKSERMYIWVSDWSGKGTSEAHMERALSTVYEHNYSVMSTHLWASPTYRPSNDLKVGTLNNGMYSYAAANGHFVTDAHIECGAFLCDDYSSNTFPSTGLYAYNLSNYTFYCKIDGINSTNPPYLSDITLELCTVDISIIPSGGYVNPRVENVITWSESAKWPTISGKYPEAKEHTFIWWTDNESNAQEISANSESLEVIIPANTFPKSSTVRCKIRYRCDTDPTEYYYSDVVTYTTSDSIPTVKIVSPVNASIDGSIDNVFQWKYIINTSSSQKAFDLQISDNNGSTWTDVFNHAEQSETSAIVPADTLLAGTVLWRVRAYNTDDVASEWSTPASIVVRAAPQTPTFSKVSTTPRITVEWQSVGQQGYQIKADGYDSGTIFGTGKVFTIPRYYENGKTVSIYLRVKNRFGRWSKWAETNVKIVNASLGEITASVSVKDNAAIISSSRIDGIDRYYVLRDGKAIGKITDQVYRDYGACGTHEYRVMAVDDSGNYAVSKIVKATVLPEAAVIGIIGETVDWVHLLKRRRDEPEIQTQKSEDISYQFYSGRTLPVAYSSKFITREKQISYTVYKAEADKLEAMIGRIVIYKDYAGNKIFGILNDLKMSNKATRPDVSMGITEIDYSEGIAYE